LEQGLIRSGSLKKGWYIIAPESAYRSLALQ